MVKHGKVTAPMLRADEAVEITPAISREGAITQPCTVAGSGVILLQACLGRSDPAGDSVNNDCELFDSVNMYCK